MILRRVRIKNFRSIRECDVELGPHTAILGGNGAGKSTVLRAIERFYASSTNIELDDFYGRSTEAPIEIELTFGNLNAAELELFGSRVHDGEMAVVRIFEAGAGRNNGRYYGKSRQHLAFAGIRSAPGATEKRAAYTALRGQGIYTDLQTIRRAEDIEEQLSSWEAAHPDQCGLGLDSGQFLGFTNVGRGSLQRFTSFVFIPAVREAGADAVDAKGAVIARLMELVVRSAIQRRQDIQAFQSEVSDRYRRLTEPTSLTELGELSSTLTETLKRLYLEAAVNLRWRQVEDFLIPLPAADVLIDDDGFEGPVDRKGHGLQRAFILTLLQHLAHASAESERQGEEVRRVLEEVAPQDSEATSTPETGTERPAFVLPGLILAIEEPELYQHPTKQRHFAKVLRSLSEGALPGVAAQTQVIFASHSSLFVAADKFDEIRLARRRALPDMPHKECVLTSSSLNSICRRLEAAFGETQGTRTIEGLRSRLHVLGPELSEGFFADLVVLVEGPSDKAAITAAASLSGVDLEANGIAILAVTGKTGLANPTCIFQELQIPTFIVWDCDRGSDDAKTSYNRALQHISNVEDQSIADYISAIEDQFAAFEVNLETTIKDELGSDSFNDCVDAARNKFGLQSRGDVTKSPAAMGDVLKSAEAIGKRSGTLQRIVAAILRLRAAQ
jgi:hypothetical protein